MKHFLFITLMFAVIFGHSQNLKKLDEKNGFRNMKFDMSIDSCKNMILVDSSGDSRMYKKSDEDMKIGDYELKNVYYMFYKNQLYSISIKTEGYTNSRGVLSVMENLYGKGYQSNEYIEEYSWWGKNVSASYDENSINHSAKIYFWSIPISNQKDKKEKDKKAESGM